MHRRVLLAASTVLSCVNAPRALPPPHRHKYAFPRPGPAACVSLCTRAGAALLAAAVAAVLLLRRRRRGRQLGSSAGGHVGSKSPGGQGGSDSGSLVTDMEEG